MADKRLITSNPTMCTSPQEKGKTNQPVIVTVNIYDDNTKDITCPYAGGPQYCNIAGFWAGPKCPLTY